MPDEICEFVHSVGINMVVGYGLTESTATVSCFLDVYKRQMYVNMLLISACKARKC